MNKMTKTINRERIAVCISMSIIVLLFTITMLLVINSNSEDEIVKCYDERGNKIIDMECIREGNNISDNERFWANIIVPCVFGLVEIFLIIKFLLGDYY